jgi:hypothetical protein
MVKGKLTLKGKEVSIDDICNGISCIHSDVIQGLSCLYKYPLHIL